MPEMKVGGRRVGPVFDPERPLLLPGPDKFFFQLLFIDELDCPLTNFVDLVLDLHGIALSF